MKSLKYSFKKRNIVLTSKEDKSNWSPPSVPEKGEEEMAEDCQFHPLIKPRDLGQVTTSLSFSVSTCETVRTITHPAHSVVISTQQGKHVKTLKSMCYYINYHPEVLVYLIMV